MPERNIIVIGASAGGVEALRELAAELPQDIPAAILVVVHVSPFATSHLPEILSRAGPVPARHAQDGEPVEPGRIYIAPQPPPSAGIGQDAFVAGAAHQPYSARHRSFVSFGGHGLRRAGHRHYPFGDA